MCVWQRAAVFGAVGVLLTFVLLGLYKRLNSRSRAHLHLNLDKMPGHLAVVMDGNGRWALKRKRERVFGHTKAVSRVKEIVKECARLNIKYLTLYAFSTENWGRPQIEVQFLLNLIESVIAEDLEELVENNVRLSFIGDITRLPVACKKVIFSAIEKSKNNSGMNLIIALSYGSRWELSEALKKVIIDTRSGIISLEAVNESFLSKYLETSSIPDPDFLIRTGGEYRLSNFMLVQLAYTELYFTPVLWPDFTKKDLHLALLDYQGRDRRFGSVK